MEALITIVHIIVCFVLILAVLLQSGKAADLAGAFGGVGSQSVFGPRGSQTLLTKATTTCAVLFMITSFALWLLKGKESGSVMEGTQAPVTEQVETTDTKKSPATTDDKAAATEAKTPTDKKQPAKQPTEKKAANPEKKDTPPVKK